MLSSENESNLNLDSRGVNETLCPLPQRGVVGEETVVGTMNGVVGDAKSTGSSVLWTD